MKWYRSRRNSRHAVIAKRRRKGLRWGLGRFVALVIVTIALSAVGIYQVHENYRVVRMGYVLDQDLFEYRRQHERNKRLKLSIASLKHPASAQRYAREELGMHVPTAHDEFVVPTPPTRADQRADLEGDE